MRGKTFLILLVVAGVLAALTFLRFGNQKQTGGTEMGRKLFADLPVNQVSSVTIAGTENSVTLVKGDKTWQVEDRGGYPADFGRLRDVVVNLSRLKIGRSFNGTAESLARLSLLPPSATTEEGRGTQIVLKDSSGDVLADVVLGQARKTDEGGSGGQYLKKSDGDTVFLVDGSFRFLKTAPAEWLQDEIFNIKADQVQSVACYAGDDPDPVYMLARPEKDQAPLLSPLPSGRNVDSAKIDQVFDALAPLTLDDVASADNDRKTKNAGAERLVYRLYDGRQLTLFPESDGKENYHVRVMAEEIAGEAIEVGTAASTADNASQDKPSDAKADKNEKDADAPKMKTAEQINDELGSWVFSIKKWQFDSLITQPDGLLQTVEKEGRGTS